MTGNLYALVLVLGVLDGDSFRARVQVWPGVFTETVVRVAGIDAPETAGQCAEEKRMAQSAKLRLAELLTSGKVRLSAVKPDKFGGRVDAVVTVDNKPVADVLLAESLVKPYDGKARGNWCP